jgi:WD40 repeat protein
VIAFAPDSKRLATGSTNNLVRIWDVSNDKPTLQSTLLAHNRSILAVNFTPDGKGLLSSDYEGKVLLWQLLGEKSTVPRSLLPRVGYTTTALAFAPDCKTLALAQRGPSNEITGEMHLVDVSGEFPRLVKKVKAHNVDVESIGFSPDGKRWASADQDGRVFVWETASGKKYREWQLPGPVSQVGFAPDGRHLAIANGNGAIYIVRLPGPGT